MTDTEAPPHFHIWLRSGRVFAMVVQRFASRQHASKVAKVRRPVSADRMVIACVECPPSKRSTRPAPRWSWIAAELRVDPADLRAAWDADRGRTTA